MKLFDESERTYMGNKDHHESSYAFLNRSALPRFAAAREVLEEWFTRYPPAHQLTLAKNFTADTYGPHLGAFFEMYTFALLQKQGLEVHVEQVVDTARGNPIDFVIGAVERPQFCVEATVIAESEQTEASQRQMSILDEHLSDIPFKAVLLVDVVSTSTQPLPYADIAASIAHWLAEMAASSPRDEMLGDDADQVLSYTWEGRGWELHFEAGPNEGSKGLIVLQRSSGWTGAPSRLAKRLDVKAAQHRGVTIPYVIAVDALSRDTLYRSADSILADLLGTEVYHIDRDSLQVVGMSRSPALPRRPDRERGLWLGRSGPRNRHVSAVLLVDEAVPWSVPKQTPLLWHNPWALRPLSSVLWQGPQAIIEPQTWRCTQRKGKSIEALLDLDM